MLTAQFARDWLDVQMQKNDWVQIVVYTILAVAVASTLAIAAFCVARGGNLDWSYRFGIFLKVACRFNR